MEVYLIALLAGVALVSRKLAQDVQALDRLWTDRISEDFVREGACLRRDEEEWI